MSLVWSNDLENHYMFSFPSSSFPIKVSIPQISHKSNQKEGQTADQHLNLMNYIDIADIVIMIWNILRTNQWVLYRFDVVYLHNLVGPCSPWVWVLECWNFFPDLLTYVSTWGFQRFLIWGLFILRPEAAWECLRNCDLQTKYKL